MTGKRIETAHEPFQTGSTGAQRRSEIAPFDDDSPELGLVSSVRTQGTLALVD